MGSATTQAIAATTAALDAASAVDLDVARELFAAARALGESTPLAGALADSAAAPAARAKVVSDVFGSAFSPVTTELIATAVQHRWSTSADLVDGIEELAVRATAKAAPGADIEGELFAFSRMVAANPELELALGSRMGDDSAKGPLVNSLLGGRVDEATELVASSLIQQPRERRVRELLARGMEIVAAQRGRVVATVSSAVPLSAAQVQRLSEALAAKYDTEVSLNTVVDPATLGGLRVQIADDVIDGTVAARLAELRQRLAG
jgi:F-type H+-transporting ATPase subunit delta